MFCFVRFNESDYETRRVLFVDTLEQLFPLNIKILPIESDHLVKSRVLHRNQSEACLLQVFTPSCLNILADIKNTVPGCVAIVAITSIDIFPHDHWNFAFGHASPRNHVAIVSACRLRSSEKGNYSTRVAKVVVHEIGHLFGLEHCNEPLCRMRPCKDVKSLDAASVTFCRECIRKLLGAGM